MYLSVIIPSYNEEKRLPKTLAEVDKYLRTREYPYEIIVINDGSKDKTAEVVSGLKEKIANLVLIDNKDNHGKGYVSRQGLIAAKGKYRLFMDADNSTSVDQFEKMIPWFEKGFDIVIGSRDVRGAVLNPPQPWWRRMVGNIFNLATQFLIGLWGVWDTQCGFKALTDRAVSGIMPKCKIDRFAFDPEILKIGRRMGFKIKEIPVVWVNDTASTVGLKSMVKMGIDLLKIRWNFITGKYK